MNMQHIITGMRFGLFREHLPVVRFSSLIPVNRENDPNFAIVTYLLLSLNALSGNYATSLSTSKNPGSYLYPPICLGFIYFPTPLLLPIHPSLHRKHPLVLSSSSYSYG